MKHAGLFTFLKVYGSKERNIQVKAGHQHEAGSSGGAALILTLSILTYSPISDKRTIY